MLVIKRRSVFPARFSLPPSINTGAATIQVAAADPALLALDPNAFTVTHKVTTGADFRVTTISFVTPELATPRLRMNCKNYLATRRIKKKN